MKVRILHVSDPHGEGRTMRRLDAVARFQNRCDVVALTGDVVKSGRQVTGDWNTWPQPHKLSVPGNHDRSHTFDRLTTWLHSVPWEPQPVGDLLFVGVGELPKGGAEDAISLMRIPDHLRIHGIVLLTHYQPDVEEHPGVVAALATLAEHRAVLILHGHDHPRQFPGCWKPNESLGPLTISRSHLCSLPDNEGWAHLITWHYGGFTRERVQANWLQ